MKSFLECIPSSNKRKLYSKHGPSNSSSHSTKRQMFLDLGQKSFNKTIKCLRCSMEYVGDDIQDRTSHEKYCKSAESLTCRLGNVKILNTVKLDKNLDVDFALVDHHKLNTETFKDLLGKILVEVDGSVEYTLDGDILCYLCIHHSNKQLLGLIITEQLTKDTQMLKLHRSENVSDILYPKSPSTSYNTSTSQTHTKNDDKNKMISLYDDKLSYSINKENQSNKNQLNTINPNTNIQVLEEDSLSKPKLGIRQIWVNNHYRRQGIATYMLDNIRRYAIYGDVIIDKDNLAFSQPTIDGKNLALNYCNQEYIWIYP